MKIIKEALSIVEELNEEIFDNGYEGGDYLLSVTTDGYEFNITMGGGLDIYRSVDEDLEIPLKSAILDKINEMRNAFNEIYNLVEESI